MTRHATTTSADVSDAMADASDEMGTAMESTRRGASEILPAVGGFVSRTVYTTSYAVSYGVVFPAMVIARAIPKENALVHGLADGAMAARDRVFGWAEAVWDGQDEIDGEMVDEDPEAAPTTVRRRRTTRARGGRGASH